MTPSSLRESIDFEYFSLAEEYYSLKKWDKALDFYTKSKQSKNFYAKSVYKSALIFIEKKQYNESEILFDELVENDPGNANFLSYLAFVKAKQKKFLEAIDLYQKILLLYPMNQTAKKNLALAYWYEGYKDEAKKIEAELLDENPLDLSLRDFFKEEPAPEQKVY